MLECINPHWRATCWLQVAVQGITEEEVPWYELVTPLMSGAEGMALSLAKHLLAVWWWNIKVHGEDDCPPTLTVLNIGQFMTDEETAGGMGEPHWFMAYSHTLQWVGEVAHGWKWEWPTREALEVKASPLVHTFWHETGMDLSVASIKLLRVCSQGPILPEGKQPHCPRHHFPGQVGSLHPQFKCLGPIGSTAHSGYTACSYRGRAVWLLLWTGGRSRPCDAGSTILGYGRRGPTCALQEPWCLRGVSWHITPP